MPTLGQNISTLRKRLGMTQEQLTDAAKKISAPEKIRLSTAYLSMIERDDRSPSYKVLAAIAKVLNTTVPKLYNVGMIPEEIILSDVQQKIVDRIVEATREGSVQDWVERIADIARNAQLPLEKICWQGSPHFIATSVVAYAVWEETISSLEKILNEV